MPHKEGSLGFVVNLVLYVSAFYKLDGVYAALFVFPAPTHLFADLTLSARSTSSQNQRQYIQAKVSCLEGHMIYC